MLSDGVCCYGHLSGSGGAKAVWFYAVGSLAESDGSHGALSVGLCLLWHDGFVHGALSRECDSADGVHLVAVVVPDGCFVAAKQYSWCMAGRVVDFPQYFWCQSLSAIKQYGRQYW